ncbi:hypothetical protein HA402_015111 [Bradysia odoriphaga]|nr:hypothetical protein HA402_015111 [Bradysia odoriphaga]
MSVMEPQLITNYSPIPEWLNLNFLEKSIRKHSKNDFVVIQNFTIVPATAKGENFASVMFRINVKYHLGDEIERSVTFLVKAAFEDNFIMQILNELNVFDKELEMYQCVLPKLRILLDNAGHRGDLFAGTMYVSFSKKAIVFEDLTQKGYRMPNSVAGLDVVHTKIVLRKLAKFHGKITKYLPGMLNRNTTTFDHLYLSLLDSLIEVIGMETEWTDYCHYAEKLTNLRLTLAEKGKRSFDAKPHQFNTLIHGDLWVNNTMFTYNSKNEPEKMMLVDFQFCCWASPAVDLHYFFNTSLTDELRLNSQDELVQFYHSELYRMLTSLRYKKHIPTLHEFHVQFIENSFYAFISALLVQPIHINENCEDADLIALFGTGEKAARYRHTVFSNPKVHRNIKQLLPIFDRKGLLN